MSVESNGLITILFLLIHKGWFLKDRSSLWHSNENNVYLDSVLVKASSKSKTENFIINTVTVPSLRNVAVFLFLADYFKVLSERVFLINIFIC